ncbi:H+transporting two-sector ATPase B/B' subunit [Solidesulfovibrio carbinoliphilus subsp. oakridgensis]|uniref:ATP synthase subunit b n=1 Tax=Solidesulfovibrio carbinoliphilus subsp. oakridgensis TaxID=694327 RepID=G7QAG4_9BACT|nr:ATP synthase F0 subunit B [Solidesulfovibrio carbinoliphilus]EHJ48717.1 H+transporting two-sector ATPase B/B' subunit [Solidesulfovibrio carbinoliphilus subsp. oakridgensis]
MIDLNATFFVQFVNFLLILILLNVILIGPIRRVLKKRAEHVASQMEGIESFAVSADAKLRDYEQALDAARQAATAERTAMKAEGQAQEKTLLDAAGAEAAGTVQAARADIAAQTAAAQKALKSSVSGLASKAVAKVLAA